MSKYKKNLNPYTGKPKLGVKYIAHAHFIAGKLIYDKDCEYCVGVLKPPKTPEEIAEKKRLKLKYYLEWKEKQEVEVDSISPEDQHLADIMKYG